MRREVELTLREFEALANTDAMIVFLNSKYIVSHAEAEFVRKHATMPFFVRGNDYPQEDLVVYFATTDESLRFQLMFEEMRREAKPQSKILDIQSKIKPVDKD